MKAARVLLFVYCALLIIAIGCGGTSNLTSQTPNPGAPPSTGGNGGGSGGGNGGGNGGGSPSELLLTIENPKAASSVETFSISSNGSLSHIASANTSFDAADIVANSKFAFVGNTILLAPNHPPIQVISYAIGSSGALTTADQVSFTNSDDTTSGLLLDAPGTHVYVTSINALSSGRATTFAADAATGKLTYQPPDAFTPTAVPLGRMALSPNGLFVYVATFTPHHTAIIPGIELLLRDPASGHLSDSGRQFHGTIPSADAYFDLAFSAGGQYLLGLDLSRKITVFAVNPATGDLTVASELLGNFQGMAVDRAGDFAIVTDDTGGVASYRIHSDGTLTIAGTAKAAAGAGNVTVAASNKFVYVQNKNAPQIFGFTFDPSGGALVSVPGSPFTAAAQPIRMAAVGK